MARERRFFAQPGSSLVAAAALLAGCATAAPARSALPEAGLAAHGRATQSVTGDVRAHKAFASRELGNQRDVWVYVPPGYDAAAGKRYPVLYMHDGNNLFDGKSAFGGHEWQVDETAERLIGAGELPPLIIVGVANTDRRLSEYTWVPGLLAGKQQGGDGKLYAGFLIDELKPFIDRTYRTKRGRADTAVMGSSLGGLMSLYLGRHHADTFGKLGVMSPSVWWAERAVLDEAPRLSKSLRIWLDMGHREGREPEAALADARALNERLLAAGFAEGQNLRYFEDREGGHDERAWAHRLPMALKYLFQ